MNDLFSTAARPTRTVRVVFDGGAKGKECEPGTGWGYGSYRIDRGPIERVDFNNVMTAQAAEVLTLIAALSRIENPEITAVEIAGDSQVALSCAKRIANQRAKVKLRGSERFQQSVQELSDLVRLFADVKTTWHPREKSVALFGH